MGVIEGLAGIREEVAKRPAKGDFEEKVPAKWLSLEDGQSVKLVFLNEIDKDSPKFSEKNGLAIFSLQHTNPNNWKKNAACTKDEGDCYGCAQGWKQNIVFYVNVLDEDAGEVKIFSRGYGSPVTQALLEMAGDEEFGSAITDKRFKLSRKGKGKDDTVYTLTSMPLPAKGTGVKVEDHEVYDLKKYVFTVAPERQETYYTDGKSGEAVAETRKPPVAAAVNETW